MSYVRPLGPIVPTGSGYEVFSCPNCAYATVQVQNGAVDYSIGQGESTMQSTFSVPDDTLLPGSGIILGPLQAIRFKAHAPVSNPAPQVSIRAEKEVPLGVSLSPAWTPSYATIDALGNISANFSGHVAAHGLDLDAQSGADVDKLQWVRTHQPTPSDIPALDVGVHDNDLLGQSGAWVQRMRAKDSPTNPSFSQLIQQFGSTAGLSLFRFQVRDAITNVVYSKLLLDSLGRSDWLMWGPWADLTFFGVPSFWANIAGEQKVQYRISTLGDVQVRGPAIVINAPGGPGTGSPLGLLPAGFRPPTGLGFAVPGSDPSLPGNQRTTILMLVQPDGSINPYADVTGRAPTFGVGATINTNFQFSTIP